jgi:hypothetical protein
MMRWIRGAVEIMCKMTNPAKLCRKKEPKKGRERKQGTRTEVQASKQPNKGGPQGGKGATKNRSLHHSHEANQLQKGKVNPMKLLA